MLALSGAGNPEAQRIVLDWAQQYGLAGQVRILHDALPVLEAGTPAGCGVAVLIAGTGAVAFARNAQQATQIAGGWGYWFGDEGSAFAIGQAALRAVAQAADGRGPHTTLTASLCERIAVAQPRQILTALSAAGDVRGGIAQLADLVSAAAEAQDPVAEKIIAGAAEDLAQLVAAAAQPVLDGAGFPARVGRRGALRERRAAQRPARGPATSGHHPHDRRARPHTCGGVSEGRRTRIGRAGFARTRRLSVQPNLAVTPPLTAASQPVVSGTVSGRCS